MKRTWYLLCSLLLMLCLSACAASTTHAPSPYLGQWETSGGAGTMSCDDGSFVALEVVPGIASTVREIGGGDIGKNFDQCEFTYREAEDGSLVATDGQECRYDTSTGTVIQKPLEDTLFLWADGTLVEVLKFAFEVHQSGGGTYRCLLDAEVHYARQAQPQAAPGVAPLASPFQPVAQ